jgi:L-alanine-DL-glutamate epimerase-like enolase superfamily enzyme
MSPNHAAHTRILDAQVAFVRRPFLRPLHLSSGVIEEITEAQAEVRVAVDGQEATGRGVIYLSDLWAWPDAALPHARRDAALRRLCEQIAAGLPALCGGEAAHPLELGLRLHHNVGGIGLETDPPMLARVLCASPFDAALHDATGQALGLSAFALYREPVALPSADPYFVGSAACAAIARTLRPVPVLTSDAWLVVGSTEALEAEVAPWVRERGYRAFKLKLLGRAVEEDAARTVAVFRAVREFGAHAPRLCADPNGAYPDAASVQTYLETVRSQDADAFAALEYLEQPTERDITVHSDDWEPVTRLKPVLLDEGLTGFDVMETARAQGWSGFALKTCKGHSFALTAAAWAQQNDLLVALQDLTNPGIAALHAALLAAYVPTINGVELNSPQFTPAANADVLPYLITLLEPRDGTHRLPVTAPPGLGTKFPAEST